MIKKRKIKKEVKQFLFAAFILILILIAILAYKRMDRFDYEKSFDEVVLTVSNNSVSECRLDITLRSLGYYILTAEKKGQEAALVYNEDEPLEYWNLYLNEDMTEDSGYISDIAKRSIITYCVRDCIYNIEASLNGFELDAEYEEEIKADAEFTYLHFTDRERKDSGLSLEAYKNLYLRETRAHEYMLYLASFDNETVLESITLKYDVNGNYYKSLLNNYTYLVNEEIWENVRIGHVTVN